MRRSVATRDPPLAVDERLMIFANIPAAQGISVNAIAPDNIVPSPPPGYQGVLLPGSATTAEEIRMAHIRGYWIMRPGSRARAHVRRDGYATEAESIFLAIREPA